MTKTQAMTRARDVLQLLNVEVSDDTDLHDLCAELDTVMHVHADRLHAAIKIYKSLVKYSEDWDTVNFEDFA